MAAIWVTLRTKFQRPGIGDIGISGALLGFNFPGGLIAPFYVRGAISI